MLTLVIGGAASGKSAYAEQLACSLAGERLYLATMLPSDAESFSRIEKHRRRRAALGFRTVERGMDLAGLEIPEGMNVLLEDLSNLLANEMFLPNGGGLGAVQHGLDCMVAQCAHLTVVSNEIFSGGADYEGETLLYMKNLACLNRELAERADAAVEVVSGLRNVLKGKLP